MSKYLEELADILDQFGEDVTKGMIAILRQNNKLASGNLIKSFDYYLLEKANDVILNIEYADYGKYVDEGRRPGSFPPPDAIKKWCRLKGIPESAAFPIGKKIHDKGIKAVNFTKAWNTELNKLKRSDEFSKALQAAIDSIAETINNG